MEMLFVFMAGSLIPSSPKVLSPQQKRPRASPTQLCLEPTANMGAFTMVGFTSMAARLGGPSVPSSCPSDWSPQHQIEPSSRRAQLNPRPVCTSFGGDFPTSESMVFGGATVCVLVDRSPD